MLDLITITMGRSEAKSLGVPSGLYRASTVSRRVEDGQVVVLFAVVDAEGRYLGELERRYRHNREVSHAGF